jgi:hypothetical protein
MKKLAPLKSIQTWANAREAAAEEIAFESSWAKSWWSDTAALCGHRDAV